ncbi:hypothetical protein STEG23_019152 [Scotinomys teguina]
MKFADKWKELENIILSEVTQTQKDKHEDGDKLSGLDLQTSKSDNGIFLTDPHFHVCDFKLSIRVDAYQ